MNKQMLRHFLPAILIFIILGASMLALANKLTKWGMNQDVLIIGNLGLFVLSFISFIMMAKGLQSKSNPVFFKMIYGSFMIKLVVVAGAAFGYILWAGKSVSKASVFFCMGLYIIYTFIEVSGLMKLAKKKNNA